MIDIGQIEGGFVYGLGFNLLEDIVYDKVTGAVLNDGTWVSAFIVCMGQALILFILFLLLLLIFCCC